jgi:UDP-N-acetylmuramoylalanine--D-glutamate ligase
MDAYIAAKKHIIEFQTADDVQVLCADDLISRAFNTPARTIWFSLNDEPAGEGAWMDDAGQLRVRVGTVNAAICHRRELQLMGAHNILNVLAACAISAAAGAPDEAMRAVATSFKGVAHRLQWVGEINGVRYYDDSIATAPERLIAALRCFEQPVILLCGGRDKHLPWGDAAAQMRERCKRVVLFGEMAPMVAEALQAAGLDAAAITRCNTLDEAVEAARAAAMPGDVVLLSPGGTSYDAYKDFAQRGDHFSQLVTQLATRG